MALIKCPECGTMFSEFASGCPKCACPVEIAKKEITKDEVSIESQFLNSEVGHIERDDKHPTLENVAPMISKKNKKEKIDFQMIGGVGFVVITFILLIAFSFALNKNQGYDEAAIGLDNESSPIFEDSMFVLNNKKLRIEGDSSSETVYTKEILSLEECNQLISSLGTNANVLRVLFDSIPGRAIEFFSYIRFSKDTIYYKTIGEASKAYIEGVKKDESSITYNKNAVAPEFDKELESLLPLLEKRIKKEEKKREAEEAKMNKEEKKDFLERLKSACWQEDVDVTWSGTTITFTGYQFATNKNIQYFQDNIYSDLKKYGFKRVKYRWSKGASEYTYYDI